MEIGLIRDEVQKLMSLSMWMSLLPSRRDAELKKIPKWRKYWKAVLKSDAKDDDAAKAEKTFVRLFMRRLIDKYFEVLHSIDVREDEGDIADEVGYCEYFIMLMIDLEALLPTRRFFDTILDDSRLVVVSAISTLATRLVEKEGRLFLKLLGQLKFYTRFEISNETGEELSKQETALLHYERITALQRAIFSKYPEMRQFALSTVASVDDHRSLEKYFSNVSTDVLYAIAQFLSLVPEKVEGGEQEEKTAVSRKVLQQLLTFRHEKRISQLQELNEMPLYPTESVIWDEDIVPGEYYNGEGVLALPKLNLQFLTLQDYLLRNFKLFQLESTYEIRGDVEDAVSRLKPWCPDDGEITFNGWARMAQPITSFNIVEVAKPNIGEKQPSRVRADVSINLSVRDGIKNGMFHIQVFQKPVTIFSSDRSNRYVSFEKKLFVISEWENLRKHDVCFLVTCRPRASGRPEPYDFSKNFVTQLGVLSVRGCEVEGMLDDNGRVIEEGPEPKPQMTGEGRTFRVMLDTNQYHLDMEKTSLEKTEDVYDTFNILMRRKPKENNFKAVLETMRELMNTKCVVPDFLHDILLGYGDPAAAHYRNMPNTLKELDFCDTFVDFEHLRLSFPGYDIRAPSDKSVLVPPFKISFEEPPNEKPHLECVPYVPVPRNPYPKANVKLNGVRFTPTQVEAIRAGMNPGLTLVVGPPGTGKTDVAVQIISNIYHNFPAQRTLIVTHSNQALNQLFEKIMCLDVDERHLLRLGHGEEALETDKDFSRYGRVNYVLAKRLELLDLVSKLQKSLGVPGDVAYTCETAGHFYNYEILPRWEQFLVAMETREGPGGVKEVKDIDEVVKTFPFTPFFNDLADPLFSGKIIEKDLEKANCCWRHISDIFEQLDEFRPFELLRSGLDRTRYLVVKEAKIVAMTCTHAALKRKELSAMGFKYDNILMEESAQILEIETFIPLLLQNPVDGYNRLKRWIMIGDHHQLPPVIKNMAFQKFSNMEQSLFTRLVRLNVPTVDLDAQGRARPSISALYNWRYKSLGNLSHVLSRDEFVHANAGFSYEFQLINVDDFNGVGESQPSPFFYQNLAEAEFAVATFMYMRLIGYPAEKISILTTYNGQKHLIRDVVKARCAANPMMGQPHKITTVDKFQGQQNDYIILSLVRTYNVGHLRDVRRLVVAMSRARLGMYIFGRANLFKNCYELQPAFNLLMNRPLQLHLCQNEVYKTNRMVNVAAPNPLIMRDMQQMCKFVYDFYANKVSAMQQIIPKKGPETAKPKADAGTSVRTKISLWWHFIILFLHFQINLPKRRKMFRCP
jgi:intron-binding protein aquarius